MKLKDLDIVYVLKPDKNNEELKYSIRSVEKNFPHKNIWFVGGLPDGLLPDSYIPSDQTSIKYYNVHNLIEKVAFFPSVSEDFVLFNDDFFVLKKVKDLPVYVDNDLNSLINRIESSIGRRTFYTRILKQDIELLRNNNRPTLNFEVHLPMVFNRKLLQEVLWKYPNCLGIRSLYGNEVYSSEQTTNRPDVKVLTMTDVIPEDFVSTSDRVWKLGFDKKIKFKFRKPSPYEQ